MFLKLLLLLAVVAVVAWWARRTPAPAAASALSVREAASVLGVAADASKEEIVEAHRRLIRSVHPDRGGSDYLARQINDARDLLLSSKR